MFCWNAQLIVFELKTSVLLVSDVALNSCECEWRWITDMRESRGELSMVGRGRGWAQVTSSNEKRRVCCACSSSSLPWNAPLTIWKLSIFKGAKCGTVLLQDVWKSPATIHAKWMECIFANIEELHWNEGLHATRQSTSTSRSWTGHHARFSYV